MDQWKKVASSGESCFLLHHVDGWVPVRSLPGEHMALGCTVGRRQAGRGRVMLWAMLCLEILGPSAVSQSQNGSGCFEEHNTKFIVLTWPPNSLDLNLIEHLWDVLDKQATYRT